jgi:hypothetical protein
MKKDKLLQHQLVRLHRLAVLRNPDVFHPSAATTEWLSRYWDIAHRAVCRSLTRYANGL